MSARTCYRIVLGIRQSETHTTNAELYAIAGARPITTIIRERQLQFTGHCLRRVQSDEPANIYALYSSNLATVHQRVPQQLQHSYTDQISKHLCADKKIKFTAADTIKYAKDKSGWIK
jgi:hypothetical protein